MDPMDARPARRGEELRAAADAGLDAMIEARVRQVLDLWQRIGDDPDGDGTPLLPPERLAPPWLDNRRPGRFGGPGGPR